ncbi:hypothetical protein [Streptomyces sp. NPDC051286]|uniref:hypothetical protein n=1 Tax=Streptomyces sp. NPDC051286 TaxID=3365647 RepID=UPI003789ED87
MSVRQEHDRAVVLDLRGLHHTAHAYAAVLEGWAAERKAREALRRADQERGGEGVGVEPGRIATLRSAT